MKIINRFNKKTIYENGRAKTMKQLVEMAVFQEVSLEDANIRDADLAAANLQGADLKYADLKGANLEGADLAGADLTGVNLQDTKMKGADLAGAELGLEVPIIENIHKKIYKAASSENALEMDEWHTCETTHCIAGWAVVLAGEQGKKLEEKITTATAATLIYHKSDPKNRVPSFYKSNEEALEELKQLAESE